MAVTLRPGTHWAHKQYRLFDQTCPRCVEEAAPERTAVWDLLLELSPEGFGRLDINVTGEVISSFLGNYYTWLVTRNLGARSPEAMRRFAQVWLSDSSYHYAAALRP